MGLGISGGWAGAIRTRGKGRDGGSQTRLALMVAALLWREDAGKKRKRQDRGAYLAR